MRNILVFAEAIGYIRLIVAITYATLLYTYHVIPNSIKYIIDAIEKQSTLNLSKCVHFLPSPASNGIIFEVH